MAKPTRLRVSGERFVDGDVEPGSPLAEAMLAQHIPLSNGAAEHGEDGERVVQYLRNELAQQQRLTTEAVSAAQLAEKQIEQAYGEARQAIQKAEERRADAENRAADAQSQAQQRGSYFATIGLALIKQGLDRFAWLMSFLINKLPALAAAYGGFLLVQQALPAPASTTLAAIGLYGALVVVPCVWLASRPESKGD